MAIGRAGSDNVRSRAPDRSAPMAVVVLVVGVAAWLAYTFYNGARFIDPTASRVVTQHDILRGTAPSPLLVPLVPLLLPAALAAVATPRESVVEEC